MKRSSLASSASDVAIGAPPRVIDADRPLDGRWRHDEVVIRRRRVQSEDVLVLDQEGEEGNEQRAVGEHPENQLHAISIAGARPLRMTVS